MGIGGTPEGITAACALKCLGGMIQAKLWPRDEAERDKALAAGHDLDRVLTTDDLVTGDNCFFVATGVTSGDLLKGVRYRSGGAHTQSMVMRSKSGTIRVIDSYHAWRSSPCTRRSTSTATSRPSRWARATRSSERARLAPGVGQNLPWATPARVTRVTV